MQISIINRPHWTGIQNPEAGMYQRLIVEANLLNDLDKLPKQTITIKADGNKGETRSSNIPATISADLESFQYT